MFQVVLHLVHAPRYRVTGKIHFDKLNVGLVFKPGTLLEVLLQKQVLYSDSSIHSLHLVHLGSGRGFTKSQNRFKPHESKNCVNSDFSAKQHVVAC
jgi:hypothetical protein